MKVNLKIVLIGIAAALMLTQAQAMRWYSPSTARWLSRDPIGDEATRTMVIVALEQAEDVDIEAESTKPVYVFVLNDPVNRSDAMGLWPSKNHWLLYPEPNPLAHEKAIRYTTPSWLPDPEAAKHVLEMATIEVDRHQAVRDAYMHAMRAPWQSKPTAKQKANDFVRIHLAKAEILLCCPSDVAAALSEFGIALHSVQDSTSPAHHDFQTWYSPWTDPVGAIKHIKKEGFDPGPGSHLYNATADFWKYFKCALEAPTLPQDFFAGLGYDQRP